MSLSKIGQVRVAPWLRKLSAGSAANIAKLPHLLRTAINRRGFRQRQRYLKAHVARVRVPAL